MYRLFVPTDITVVSPCICLLQSCAGPALRLSAPVQVDALCAVWISHKHADHMLGLLGILKARSANTPPLLVSICFCSLP